MAIELAPVSSMAQPDVAPDKTGKAEKSNKSDKADKSDKTNDTPLSDFMAMLAQFEMPAPDAVPLPVDKAGAVLPVVDPVVPLPQPPVLDPAALLGQMQVGLSGQAVAAKDVGGVGAGTAGKGQLPSLVASVGQIPNATPPVSTPMLATVPGMDVAAGVMTAGKVPASAVVSPVNGVVELPVEGGDLDATTALMAKHALKSPVAAGTDSLAAMVKPAENAQIDDATGKSTPSADKQPLTQSLQATLNATMAAAQNAVARTDKAVEGAAGLNPTANLGESFHQLVEVAKSDKPAEITNTTSSQAASATERAHAAPSGGAWDFSAAQAQAMPDAAGAAGAASSTVGFTADAQGSNQVALWVSKNVQSAELKLDAQGNDPVEVSISLSGGEAQVQFRSDVSETRALLSRAVAELDSAMQREGLVLSGVSVGTSAQGRGNSRTPGEEGTTSRQSATNGLKGLNSLLVSSDATGQMHGLNAMPRVSQGRVDVFV